MCDKWNFLHHPCLTSLVQLTEISMLRKIINFKSWSAGIFHFTFGRLTSWSARAKEANLKESHWDNHMVSIQSSNGYLFHKVYFTICK